MKKVLKTCIYCGKVFYKDFSCEHTMKKFKNLENLKLGYDYVICEWNKHPVTQITNFYLMRNFNKSLDEYKKGFPNVKIAAIKYIETLRKNSTENNGNSKENTTEHQRKSCLPFAIEFYERLYPDLSDDERNSEG